MYDNKHKYMIKKLIALLCATSVRSSRCTTVKGIPQTHEQPAWPTFTRSPPRFLAENHTPVQICLIEKSSFKPKLPCVQSSIPPFDTKHELYTAEKRPNSASVRTKFEQESSRISALYDSLPCDANFPDIGQLVSSSPIHHLRVLGLPSRVDLNFENRNHNGVAERSRGFLDKPSRGGLHTTHRRGFVETDGDCDAASVKDLVQGLHL